MNLLRVAAIQVGPNPSANSSREDRYGEIVEELVQKAAGDKAEILCFPEHWIREEKPDMVLEIIEIIKEVARKFRVNIIAGAFYEELEDETYVVSSVVDSYGRLIGRQKKLHLFGSEKAIAKPGSEFEVFKIDDVKFGVMVCYDVAFPEVARAFALKSIDIAFVPSRIMTAGIEPWHSYLSIRCLENRLPIVASNTVWPPRYLGRSVIIDLKQDKVSSVVYPNVLASGNDSFQAVIADIDIETARRLREARLSERRPEVYRFITDH